MSSMTAENDARFKVEVIYTNPDLELAVIEDIIRRALQAVLTEDFSVELVKGRQTPWIRPWFEEPNHPLVQAAVHEAGEVVQHPVERRYARGVADENIIAHMGVPMVLFPPRGQDEHNVNERVDVSYVDRVMVPFLHRMAGTEWKLRW
jgi:acetylornithine deacetylase/succinyl-diaminopimelate desuccinylase-like protein